MADPSRNIRAGRRLDAAIESPHETHGMPLDYEQTPDTAMPDAETELATPQQVLNQSYGSLDSLTQEYPHTRSRANLPALRPSQALRKLQKATKSPVARVATRITPQDSADAATQRGYSQTNNDDENNDATTTVEPELRKSPRSGSEGGQVRAVRRSSRIQKRFSTNPRSACARVGKSKQPQRKSAQIPTRPTRRSARLAKPLTEFHKYVDLPAELRFIVWEQAVAPRLVYIRNRAAPNYTYKIQTSQPNWFETDEISVKVSGKGYKRRFGLRNPDDERPSQLINIDMDIIVLEPCCNGCRGYHCTIHFFEEHDRESIRFLAVQTDSPHLAPFARPCWETISTSFPNVEILYLMKTALRGDQAGEKAMLRVAEGSHEKQLRERFDAWKKNTGITKTLDTLEFVAVVDQEPTAVKAQNRYKGVAERKTGLPEDIIVG